jgi:hypothetical protein
MGGFLYPSNALTTFLMRPTEAMLSVESCASEPAGCPWCLSAAEGSPLAMSIGDFGGAGALTPTVGSHAGYVTAR